MSVRGSEGVMDDAEWYARDMEHMCEIDQLRARVAELERHVELATRLAEAAHERDALGQRRIAELETSVTRQAVEALQEERDRLWRRAGELEAKLQPAIVTCPACAESYELQLPRDLTPMQPAQVLAEADQLLVETDVEISDDSLPRVTITSYANGTVRHGDGKSLAEAYAALTARPASE